MAKITQDFINNLGSLYEEIQTKDTNFLNEESEYYDEELSEFSEDIILSIALSMFSEGHNLETLLKFLSSSDEEVILEKYLSTDVTLLSEEVIHTEFVEEQLELLELNLSSIGKLFARGASVIGKGARAAKNVTKSGVTKAATAGVEGRVGKQFTKSTNVSRTEKAVERLAKNKASKAGVSAPSGKLSPKQSTELIKQARTAQAIKGVKSAATGALLTGLGVLGGYTGAKLAGGGSGGADGGAPSGGKPSVEPKAKDDFLKGSVLSKLGGREGRLKGGEFRTMAWSPESKARYKAAGGPSGAAPAAAPVAPAAAPVAAAPSGGGSGAKASSTSEKPKAKPKAPKPSDGAERRAATSAELARAQKARKDALEAGKSKEEAEKAAVQAGIGKDTKLMGGPEGPGQIDTKDVEASIKAEQERQRKKSEKASQSQVAKESYDAYDIILEYLINTEQVETLDEAHYIMLEMDETAVANIMQEYEDYLLS